MFPSTSKRPRLTKEALGKRPASDGHLNEDAPPGMDSILAELSRLRERVAMLEAAKNTSVKSEPFNHGLKDTTPVVNNKPDDDSSSPVKSEHRPISDDDLYDATPPPEDYRRKNNASNVEGESESHSSPRVSIGVRMPAVARRLAPIQELQIHPQPNTKFQSRFLHNCFGGRPIAHGWYMTNGLDRAFAKIREDVLLNREFNSIIPRRPGAHGAQITPKLQLTEIGQPFSLFIRDIDDINSRYYGTYQDMRSDCLGHNEIREIPAHVKRHLAQKLGARPANGVKSAPMLAFWRICGSVQVGWWDTERNEYTNERDNEMEEIELLARAITDEEAQNITEGEIMAAFDRLCTSLGVSLYYEYLKCVGRDSELY
ncbi:hypothetical protein NHQ30_001361 [Ciborinia camelliae]|nr:hypothetical protein NHQ30_001361 [Ciborinia camelliae]